MIQITWAGLTRLHIVLPAVVFLIVLSVRYWRVASSALRALAHPRWLNTVLENYRPRVRVFKMALRCAALVFLAVVLLQPQWGKKEETVQQEGRTVLVAMDISRSMLAQDVKPDRLAFAKQKVRALLDALAGDRVGLIIFSGDAFVQCPLTADYAAFEMFLDALDAETISAGTTALDQAIKRSLAVFEESAADHKGKIIILVTDGEDFSANLSGVREQLSDSGATLIALGVGTAEGAPIPVIDAHGNQIGHQRDADGSVVISRLNLALLESLTARSGGMCVQAVSSDEDIRRIVVAVEQHERSRFESKSISSLHERYPYFAGLSFVCLLVEWVL